MQRVSCGVLLVTVFMVLVLSALPLATIEQVSAANVLPKIHFDSESYLGFVGSNVNVSVMISNATGLFMYQVFIDFRQDLLNVESITQGDFLIRGGISITFWVSDSGTPGLIKAACALLRGGPPASGDGELFKITFSFKGSGITVLHLHDVHLYDQFASEMPFTTEDSVAMGGSAQTVGGYSFSAEVSAKMYPLLPYTSLIAALAICSIVIKHRSYHTKGKRDAADPNAS